MAPRKDRRMSKYVTVPVEPTEEMIAAAMKSNYAKESPSFAAVIKADWKAMIAAAPQEPGGDVEAKIKEFFDLHQESHVYFRNGAEIAFAWMKTRGLLQGWQDISTAPRDGTLILACGPKWNWPCVISWERHSDGEFYGPRDSRWLNKEYCWGIGVHGMKLSDEYESQPTHWQPLPSPPQSANPPIDSINNGETP